ncbi:conserved hypothetical protein [Nostocoides jenkinsii Ben 74]|uniref:Integral membrane protein n=1 Tax=Nostocoides jenkinsii Ben 74 TaxID=1193518 RepID=A0A077M526_9MICO|nr:conserved hypothetical protein [Tetrasphaera jenkinsii Ben 74]
MSREPSTVQSVTSAHESLAEEQSARIKKYLITMAIRTACFILAVVLTGWMRWTAVAGAVLLPYVAVVLANAVKPRAAGSVQEVTEVVPLLRAEAETLEGQVVEHRD